MILENVVDSGYPFPGRSMSYFQDAKPTWGKAYRREFLNQQQIRFCQNLLTREDRLFNIESILKARNGLLYVDALLYYYWQNSNSLTLRYIPEFEQQNHLYFSLLWKLLGSMTQDKGTQDMLTQSQVVAIHGVVVHNIANPDNPKSYRQRLKELKTLVRFEPNRSFIKTCPLKWFPFRLRLELILLRMGREDICLRLADYWFSRCRNKRLFPHERIDN